MISMTTFFVIICSSGSIFGHKQQPCEPSPHCSDIHDVAKITCKNGKCIISNNELEDLISEITTIDAGLCRQKCAEQAAIEPDNANNCQFYRWSEVSLSKKQHFK